MALILLIGQARSEAQTANGPFSSLPRLVVGCLYSEGAADYELLCRMMVAHLENELGAKYEWRVANKISDGAPLSGSMDILDAIGSSAQNGQSETYFSLAQSDVAYYFRHGGHSLYATPHHLRQEVVALARLYREVLHLYSRNSPAAELGDALKDWKEIYLGALGSGTLITALNVLSVFKEGTAGAGFPTTVLTPMFQRPSPTEQAAAWGGALVAGIGDPSMAEQLAQGGHLLSLSAGQQRHLQNAFSEFYSVAPLEAYGQEQLNLLEIPALLVASKRLPAEVAESLLKLLSDLDSPDGQGYQRFEALVSQSVSEEEKRPPSGLTEQIFKGVRRYAGERRHDLVLSPHRATLDLRQDGGVWELTLLLLTSLVAFVACRKAARDLKQKDSFLDLSPLLTGAAALTISFAWIHFCLLLVWRLEYAHFMGYGTDIPSPFIRHSYTELLPMVMQFIASGFSSENLFPTNRAAQLVWLSIPILLALSAFGGVLHAVLPKALNYLRDNMDKGVTMDIQNHYLIINWHPHAQNVIAQLRIQERMASDSDPLVIVLSGSDNEVDLPRLGVRKGQSLGEHTLYALPPKRDQDEDHEILTIYALYCCAEDEAALRLVRPEKAKAIVIFPDSKRPEPDSVTVLTVLRLQQILGEKSNVRVLVWCAEAKNVQLFQDSRFRLTDACSTEWAWRVLCQATRVGHVSTIYRHLLTSSVDSNEFYEFLIPEGWEGSFGTAQETVQRYNSESSAVVPGVQELRNTILLVGYFSGNDLRRERVSINPSPDSRLLPGDALLFLTYVYDRSVQETLATYFLRDEKHLC